ncbi:MAG TPA: metalloregulator ArsR/SmtB family transcription factor [Steroidobacteraceae bacterium]|jgi:DNA-binding transcriptional ArsR family regulator
MSRTSVDNSALRRRHHAAVFAAMGHETRLGLVSTLSTGPARSVAQLTGGTRLTRQAVTKHLQVLEGAGIVRSARRGRESVYEFVPQPMKEMQDYLGRISQHWDEVLTRLKALVEG